MSPCRATKAGGKSPSRRRRRPGPSAMRARATRRLSRNSGGTCELAARAFAMSSLLVRGQKGGVSVTPASAGWRYVSFNALRIPNGGRFELETEGSEACIVVIAGRCAVRIGEVGWPHVGERATPFDGPPHAIYAPPGVTVEVAAHSGDVEMAIGSAPAEHGQPARHIRPDTRREVRGMGSMERTINHIL